MAIEKVNQSDKVI